MKTITTEELKNMSHQEGLILQGCGGDLQEWIDGINGILREQGILLDGKPLDDVAVFQHTDAKAVAPRCLCAESVDEG